MLPEFVRGLWASAPETRDPLEHLWILKMGPSGVGRSSFGAWEDMGWRERGWGGGGDGPGGSYPRWKTGACEEVTNISYLNVKR